MSEMHISLPVQSIIAKGRLTTQNINILKADIFPKGVRSSHDAAVLLAINTSCREATPEWNDYFVQNLSDFVLHHRPPQGELDDAKTLTLERMLAADGVIATELEFRVLLRVMDLASRIPDSFKVFALSQLRHAINGGYGALAGRRRGHQRGISGGDIDYVRTVVEARDDERQVMVSPAVHRVLLSIDAVSNPALNDHGWVPFLACLKTSAAAATRTVAGKSGAGRSSWVAA